MKMKIAHDKFNFWKENKVAGFFQLTEQELISEFEKWLPTKERGWLEYYSMREIVQVFVAEGLNSVGNTERDFAEYDRMEKILKPFRKKHLNEI